MNKIVVYQKINRLLNRMGFDLRRFPTTDQRRLLSYLDRNAVITCLDVGANTGQFARSLQLSGFRGNILSFEPQSKAFEILKKSANSEKWKSFNVAFGDFDGHSEIHISKNSASSSLLHYENDISQKAESDSAFISKEVVRVQKIDDFITDNNLANSRIFLKIDAQGFEKKILNGIHSFWKNIYAIQVELPFVRLYQGEVLFADMKEFIESKGFFISSIESGFADFRTGQLLQADAVFLRSHQNVIDGEAS